MEWRGPLTSLLWIVVLPLLLAGFIASASVGPDLETVRADLASDQPETIQSALEWSSLLREKSLLSEMGPLLSNQDADIREETAKNLQAYNSPRMLVSLEEAIARHPDEARNYLKVLYSTSHPETLAILGRIEATHPESKIRERAFRAGEALEFDQNQRAGYYSLGNHIWNPFGQYLNSQGSLFPEGRELIELGPTPGSHYPGMKRPWIHEHGGNP